MLQEYAVDPDAIGNWQSFRYVIHNCGTDQGRVIAEYPDTWLKLVYKAAKKAHNRPIHLKSIEDRLSRIRKELIKRASLYNGTNDWLSNAENENSRQPFTAILSFHNPRSHDHVLVVDNLADDLPLWKVEREKSIERKAELLAAALDPVFRFGSEFIFVDPHFNPCEARFTNPLVSFVKHITKECRAVHRIEYHLIANGDRTPFEGNLNYFLAPNLAAGTPIKFIRWRDLPYSDKSSGGKRLHARYVLTDTAGVLVEWGLDEGNPGDFADMLLLSASLREKHWMEYQRSTSRFDFVDEVDIIGSGNV